MSKKKFSEIFRFAPKSNIKAGEGLDEGRFPFYTSSQTLSRFVNTEQHFDEALIFGTGGSASIHYADGPFSTSTDCLVAISVDKNFNTKFIYYYLFGNIQILEQGFKGAGLKHISKTYIQNIDIPIYDLEIQNRIVAILDKANALVQKRQKTIDLLDELLRVQFLEMFGPIASFEVTANSRPLGNYISIKHGFAFKSEFFADDGDYILLTPGNFKEEGGFKDRGEKQRFYNGPIPNGFILRKGDLLIAMTEQAPGLLGSPIFIPEDNTFLHNQRLGLIELKDKKINKSFLFHLFNSGLVRKIIQVGSTGVKVKHTSPSKIESINVAFPDYQSQNNFAEFAREIEKRNIDCKKSLQLINELFLSLLQGSFTGTLMLSISVELDSLLQEIDLFKSENDLINIVTNEEYLLSLVTRLNKQDFENQDLYDKAKYVAFQLLKQEERITQKYDKKSKSLKLMLK